MGQLSPQQVTHPGASRGHKAHVIKETSVFDLLASLESSMTLTVKQIFFEKLDESVSTQDIIDNHGTM